MRINPQNPQSYHTIIITTDIVSETAAITVLHVDDDVEFVDLAAERLEQESEQLTVETATSASEGLDRLTANKFDCVVSDYRMHGQTGIEFLREIRNRQPDLPFILLTGEGSEEVASDAISAGATDYLQKQLGGDQYTGLANRIKNAVEKRRAQQRAVNLDRIRGLKGDINQALMRADSRSAAEARVCEIISDSDPYLFAWIGDLNPDTQQVTPRASAGIEEGYLDTITVTVDDTPTGRGPGGTAIAERRVAVSQNITEDQQFEAWREEAVSRGYQAVAAVPLEHQERLYGELLVYASQPHAFDKPEQELLAELGGDIAYAIHSLKIKGDLHQEQTRQRALFENAPNPVIAGEEDGSSHRIINVNDAFEKAFGYTAEEVIGSDVAEAIVPEDGKTAHEQFRERVEAGESITTEVERMTAKGTREFLLHVIPYGTDGETIDGTYAWYLDITDRKRRKQEIDRTNSILRTILENLPMGVLVEDSDREVIMANDQLGNTFDIPLTGDDLIGRDCDAAAEQIKDQCAEPAKFTADIDERLANRELVHNEEIRLADGRVLKRDYLPYSLPAGDANMWLYRDITTQKEYEETLKELLASTQELQSATTPKEVATIGAKTARGVFDRPINGIHLYDESEAALLPVAWTVAVENQLGTEPPALPIENSLAGRVYRTGDSESYGKITEQQDCFTGETPFQSELIYPLGDHGVFILSETEPEAFDQVDKTLAQILSSSLTRALDRVSQRQQLESKNERLDKFASVLSHDLRNPLNVAEGRLELAQEELESQHFAPIERSHTRMRSLIDDLLSLARDGDDISELEPVDLNLFVEKCWSNVDTQQATLVANIEQTIQADRGQFKQLIENLIRNAVEHSDSEVTVTIGALDNGFFVEDDGSGIPSDERDEVFDFGYSTAANGTGFGLSIVRRIAEAHGWEIIVTEGTEGGARFEITKVTTSPD